MDRDFLIDLFVEFGPVSIRRMFSGYGISADGTNFALALRGGLFLRADEASIPDFEQEGCTPFVYQTRAKTVTVRSYWQLPERLYDDPGELAQWARKALSAAERAALAKPRKKRQTASRGASGKRRTDAASKASAKTRTKLARSGKATKPGTAGAAAPKRRAGKRGAKQPPR
jgi:DNA transformation protein